MRSVIARPPEQVTAQVPVRLADLVQSISWGWSDTGPEGFPKSVKVGRLRMYEAAAVRAWATEQIAEAEGAGARGA